MGVGRYAKQLVGGLFPSALLYRGKNTQPSRVAVTFDDGPHPTHTDKIIDVLAAAGTKATFFVQGAEVKKYPVPLRALHRAGHQIANHGFSHRSPKEIGDAAFVAEVLDTQKLIEDVVGTQVSRDFRPPYGSVSLGTFLALTRQNFRFAFWSYDSDDSVVKDAALLTAQIESAPLRGGDILLFHEDYAHTVEALPGILASLQKRGFALSLTHDFR